MLAALAPAAAAFIAASAPASAYSTILGLLTFAGTGGGNFPALLSTATVSTRI